MPILLEGRLWVELSRFGASSGGSAIGAELPRFRFEKADEQATDGYSSRVATDLSEELRA